MFKRWQLRQPPAEQALGADELSAALGLPPLISRLLTLRGLDSVESARMFLQPKLTQLHDPALMPGMERAVTRMVRAVREGQPIIIYGDYDVDGVSGSAILWHMLRLAGGKVETYIPHRIDEGYGLNNQAIAELCRQPDGGKPLIISVDCGITAHQPAQVAVQAGVDLIVTDHHQCQSGDLPQAYAIVHPALAVPGQTPYPFPHLCGAGVAFKVAWQFAKAFCGKDKLPTEFHDLLLDLLSLASLGTVADVVPLLGENRIITHFGLGQIKRTRFVGLNALIEASGLSGEKISAVDVGFKLGPRLNACGRMGHARQALTLLTSAAAEEAGQLATFLTRENDRRRATERQIFVQARQMVVESGFDQSDCRAIVLGHEGWHIGVVGIVASRLVETFARPVVLLSVEDGQAHGSARSVEGLSIYQAFHHCAASLDGFGGHDMAAGLQLKAQRIDEFRQALVAYANNILKPEDLVRTIHLDADCRLLELTPDLVGQMQKLGPFGCKNPQPTLCLRDAVVERAAQRMGGEGRHLQLTLRQGNCLMRAVAWNWGAWASRLPAGVRLDVAFEPQASEWQGDWRVEMHIKDIKLLSATPDLNLSQN